MLIHTHLLIHTTTCIRLAKKLYGDKLGQHATCDEVSVTQYLFPEIKKANSLLNPENINRNLTGRTMRRMDGDNEDEVIYNHIYICSHTVYSYILLHTPIYIIIHTCIYSYICTYTAGNNFKVITVID